MLNEICYIRSTQSIKLNDTKPKPFTTSLVTQLNKHITLIYTLFISTLLFGQDKPFFCGYGEINNGDRLCNYQQMSAFAPNEDVEKAVDEILRPTGLSKNFVIVRCPDINNAIATTSDGLRYIIYDDEFVDHLKSTGAEKDWGAYSIFAHELAHHLNGHTLLSNEKLADSRYNELQADYWSGFVLQKLGATLAQAQIAVNDIAKDGDDRFWSHPNKQKRLHAIDSGFTIARGNVKIDVPPQEPNVENYLNDGNEKFNNSLFDEAISDYDKAIALNAKIALSYYFKGIAKRELGKNDEAIEDFTKAINLKADFADALNFRGQLYYEKGAYDTCILDLSRAIVFFEDPNALAFYYRGMALLKQTEYDKAITDFSNAIVIEPKAKYYNSRGFSKFQQKNYAAAIADFNEAIKLDPLLLEAYNNRAASKQFVGDYYGAISDYKMLQQNGISNAENYFNVGYCYYAVKDYNNAILEFTQAIEKNSALAHLYFYRGVCYKNVDDHKNAIDDFSIAISMGYGFKDGDDQDIFFYRANAYYNLEDYEQALNDANKMLVLNPDHANTLYIRGFIYYNFKHDDASACADFNKACNLGITKACNLVSEKCK